MIVVGVLNMFLQTQYKERVMVEKELKNAIIGLLQHFLLPFIILRQINPNLLKSDLNVESTQSTGTVGGSAVTLVNRPPVDSLAAYPTVQGLWIRVASRGINLGTGGGRCVRGPNGTTSEVKLNKIYTEC